MNNIEQLINKLLSGQGKLSLLLLEAKPLAEKAKDEVLLSFIDKESMGIQTKNYLITGKSMVKL